MKHTITISHPVIAVITSPELMGYFEKQKQYIKALKKIYSLDYTGFEDILPQYSMVIIVTQPNNESEQLYAANIIKLTTNKGLGTLTAQIEINDNEELTNDAFNFELLKENMMDS